MTRLLTLLLTALLLSSIAVGCGSSPKPGAEKDKDMPRPADSKPADKQ